MNHFFLKCPSQVTFLELLYQWFDDVSKLERHDRVEGQEYVVLEQSYCIKITADQLALFTQLFNTFVADLALQAEQHNWWQSSHSSNIFTPFDDTKGKQANGHAFVPQCRERVILCRLFFLNKQCNSERLTVYENATVRYKKNNFSSAWVLLDDLFTQIFSLSSVLRLSLNAEYELSVQDFLPYLKDVDALYEKVKALVTSDNPLCLPQDSAFYPISDEQLYQLSEDQLLCICLEEMNQQTITSLLYRILQSNKLWEKVTLAFSNESFQHRVDNPVDKMSYLSKYKALIDLHSLPEQKNTVIIEPRSDKIQDLEHQLYQITRQLAQEKMTVAAQTVRADEVQKNYEALETSQQESRHQYKQLHANLLRYEQQSRQLTTQLVSEQSTRQKIADELKELKTKYIQVDTQLHQSQLALGQQQHRLDTAGFQLFQSMQREEKGRNEVRQLKFCIENNSLLIGMKRRAADVAPLLYFIGLIKKKTEELHRRECYKAEQKARYLVTHLDKAINQYLDGEMRLEVLKSECQQQVNCAYSQLAQWRGWKQLLLNTLLCIAGLGVGYVVAGAINYAVNKQFTFFNNTKSADLLDDLSALLKPVR